MKKERKTKPKIIFFVTSLVIILSLVQLAIAQRLSTWGEKIRQYEEQARELEEKNQQLVQEINQVSSLSKISTQAEQLGFSRSIRVVHLTPQVPVAQK